MQFWYKYFSKPNMLAFALTMNCQSLITLPYQFLKYKYWKFTVVVLLSWPSVFPRVATEELSTGPIQTIIALSTVQWAILGKSKQKRRDGQGFPRTGRAAPRDFSRIFARKSSKGIVATLIEDGHHLTVRQEQSFLQWSSTVGSCIDRLQLSWKYATILTVSNFLASICLSRNSVMISIGHGWCLLSPNFWKFPYIIMIATGNIICQKSR